ncbi:MAG TPA: signal peptidase II [Micromonosporaceae bacterium]|nr:signal peptidase II [Micromonosporaceae bacterium]
MAEQPAPEPTDDGRRTSVRSSAEPDETKPVETKPGDTNLSDPAGPRRRAIAVVFVVAAVALALDIVTKQLVVAHLRVGEPVRIIPGLLYFNSDRNGGAAFSMGTSITWVFPTIAIIVSGTIVYLARGVRSVAWAIALGLVLAGALGNLVDRLFRAPGPFRGEVVDFIALFNGSAHGFAIFNIADSCLTIGVILAVLLELFGRHRDGSRSRH